MLHLLVNFVNGMYMLYNLENFVYNGGFFFDDLVIRAPVDLAGRLVQLELWKVQIIYQLASLSV